MPTGTDDLELDLRMLKRAGAQLAKHGNLNRAGEQTRRWVDEQILRLRGRDLPAQTVEQLHAAGITANTPTQAERDRAQAWTTFLAELDWWVARHGSADVPQAATSRKVDGTGYRLGFRVKNYRALHRRGELDPARARELEARPGWTWNAFQSTWATHLRELGEVYHQRGHLNELPAPLDRWLRNQRQADLTDDQRRQLQTVPGALEPVSRRVHEFLTAARTWLDTQPGGTTMADVGWATTVEVNGRTIPLGRRVTFYRYRYHGRDGTHPLAPEAAAAIEQLPGWSWDLVDRRKKYRPAPPPAAQDLVPTAPADPGDPPAALDQPLNPA